MQVGTPFGGVCGLFKTAIDPDYGLELNSHEFRYSPLHVNLTCHLGQSRTIKIHPMHKRKVAEITPARSSMREA